MPPSAEPADSLTQALARLAPLTAQAVRAAGAAPRGLPAAPSEPPAPQGLDRAALAAAIDHTLLKPESTAAQIEQLCREAVQYAFAAVCVNSGWLPQAAAALAGSGVGLASTVGFPLGACAPQVKAYETEQAVQAGASEIDMVIDLGALKDADYLRLARDVLAVTGAAHRGGARVKVIIEAGLLTLEEKVAAARLAAEAGADFVKTSTGFLAGGATLEDVRLMAQVAGPAALVKAAGGIRTAEQARAMLRAGAARLGTSAGVAIMCELDAEAAGAPGGGA